jgi:hypothetical protein
MNESSCGCYPPLRLLHTQVRDDAHRRTNRIGAYWVANAPASGGRLGSALSGQGDPRDQRRWLFPRTRSVEVLDGERSNSLARSSASTHDRRTSSMWRRRDPSARRSSGRAQSGRGATLELRPGGYVARSGDSPWRARDTAGPPAG